MSSTQVTCTGSSDGTANIIVSGGTSPFSYTWSNGQTTSNATGLLAGVYNISVEDDNGCIVIDSVVITESDSALAFSSTVSKVIIYIHGQMVIQLLL